jgi:hypothetical protein
VTTKRLWHWRYPDPTSGAWRRTTFPMTEEEARRYPGAQPIASTLLELETEDSALPETSPPVGPLPEVPPEGAKQPRQKH